METVYAGETEWYNRFKVNGKDINLKLYALKGEKIAEELVIRLSRPENEEPDKGRPEAKPPFPKRRKINYKAC